MLNQNDLTTVLNFLDWVIEIEEGNMIKIFVNIGYCYLNKRSFLV